MEEPIKKELFDLLACPVCKAELRYNKDKDGLVCTKCTAKFPIKDGIPILLPSEIRK